MGAAGRIGPISEDSRRILVMEWLAEGVTHVSLGILVVLTAAIVHGAAVGVVYGTTAGALVVPAGLTALTGARTPVVWFKVCPFVLTGSAALLLAAALL
ncbi:MAG TPA: hypothetical protein VLN26_00815 [Gaiellaceae bacterium]|nr:hypothetical protein [Gaiellaceae bacterium]